MNKIFEVHILNESGKAKARRIASEFDFLLENLSIVCPECREMAIVRHELEVACFYAKKAMAQEKENQE